MKRVIIEIEGMSCMGCAKNVEDSLNKLKGVKKVKVLLKDKKAVVEISKEVNFEDLKSKIKEVGYNPG